MPDDDISMGELSRNLVAMERRVGEKFADLDRRLDNLQFVNRETYIVQMQTLTERIADLEDSRKWQVRTLAFAFLVAVVAPVIVAWVVTQ